jgi:hypothetical protein
MAKSLKEEFHEMTLAIQSGKFFSPCKDLAQHTSVAMKWAMKMIHHASYKYNINTTSGLRSNSFEISLSQIPASIGRPH